MPLDMENKQNRAFPNQMKNPDSGDYFNDYKYAEKQEPQSGVGEILYKWEGPEFEVYERSKRWYMIAVIFILAIVAYALYINATIMAITFILIGVVGYIYSQKDPRIVTFAITSKGVLADKELYLYDNIFSFWIFYDPAHTKAVSLHTKAAMLPFVHIPLGNENPVKIREILIKYIPEIKQEQSLINTIEKVFHL